jgi:hypothetical protein
LNLFYFVYSAIHRWLIEHPLWCVFVIAPLVSLFVIYAAHTLWDFFKVKPQQLNVWILKARISSADSRLQRLYRLRSDQSYLIVRCFQSLFLMLISLLQSTLLGLLVLLLADWRIKGLDHRSLLAFTLSPPTPSLMMGVVLSFYVFLIAALMTSADIIKSILHGDRHQETLKVNMERLRTKLLLRDHKRPNGPESD